MGIEHTQSNPPLSADSTRINPLNVVRLLRSAGGALISQATLHGQLARVEWAEEKTRLRNMMIAALSGFACLLCFMIFFGVLVIAFSWDTQYRIAAVSILTAVYGLAGFMAWRRLAALSALSGQAFAATREEIAADIALIKSKL